MKRASISGYLLLGACALSTACSSSAQDSAEKPALGFDPSFLDHTSEPCTDFYQYACGTWLAQHTPDPGYSRDRYVSGDYREDIYFSQLIEAMTSGDPDLRTAQQYYAGCLSSRRSLSAPSGQMGVELGLIRAMTSVADLPSTLAKLQSSGVSALFGAYPEVDPGDPTRYVLALADSGFSLSSPQAYLDAQTASDYEAHMTALALAAQSAGVTLTLDAASVLAFERDLVAAGGATTDPMVAYDPVREYNPSPSSELASELPDFDWPDYFRTLGFAAPADVNRTEPTFLNKLAALLGRTPFETVKQYLSWRVLERDASFLDQPLADEEFHFHRTVLEGQMPVTDQDPYICLWNTRGWFGFELAHHFVTNFVPSDLKPAASAFVETVRSAMRANFDQVAWLDDATRALAQQKLELLLPKVGYPESWPVVGTSFGPNDSYLDMSVALAKKGDTESALRLVGTVDRSPFWASPEVTNAFYSPSFNDITIPVAVLQHPFFDRERPAAFSYGALGGIIGHELTHAFDNSGRHFDGSGRLTDFWTEAAASNFEARSQCLVDQFNGYQPLPGMNVNGQATLNENIADLGGLKLAYAAFEASAPGTGGASFSAEQQFFLSFAQMWCSASSEQALAQQLLSDPHSPAEFRVNGVVRNLPEFAQAFSCPAGAPLAPVDRCEIW